MKRRHQQFYCLFSSVLRSKRQMLPLDAFKRLKKLINTESMKVCIRWCCQAFFPLDIIFSSHLLKYNVTELWWWFMIISSTQKPSHHNSHHGFIFQSIGTTGIFRFNNSCRNPTTKWMWKYIGRTGNLCISSTRQTFGVVVFLFWLMLTKDWLEACTFFYGLPIYYFLDLVAFLRLTIPVSIFCGAIIVVLFSRFLKAQEYFPKYLLCKDTAIAWPQNPFT